MALGRFPAPLTLLSVALCAHGQMAPMVRPLAPQDLLAVQTQEPARVLLASQHLNASRQELGLGEATEFRLRTTHTDAFGQTHARFRQLHRGVPVWGGEGVLHLDPKGHLLPLTDALYRNIQLSVTPSMGVSEILALAAQDRLPAGRFSRAPETELIVYPVRYESFLPVTGSAEPNAEHQITQVLRYVLAYHLHVELVEGGNEHPRHVDLILDAHTGALLKSWDTLQTEAAEATGKSQHSGTVKLSTATTLSGYELRDLARGGDRADATKGNLVLNLNHATSGPGTPYTDVDNTWGDGQNYVDGSDTNADNGQTAAVDAAYGLQASWDYFLKVHGRNGIDGAGTPTSARVHYSTQYDNAFWSNGCFCMTYGDGSTFKSMASLDVAGHELTHGVTAHTAGLIYSGESGGLNEATSDIFGTMIEFHARGGSGPVIGETGGNWTEGEQLAASPLRYLYKPSRDGRSPDAWSDTIKGLDVHYSSGPMNRCFYFLSQGASADATSQTYSSYLPGGMTGIGNDKAAPIWYRALTTYLTPASGYKEARLAALRAAQDIFGNSSLEFAAVQNAFAAINVGGPAGSGDDLQSPVVAASVTGTQGSITLSATATDNVGVSRVAFLVDGVPVGQTLSAPFQQPFDSTNLPNGVHSLVAEAFDAVGNRGISSPAAFTLDNNVSQYLINPGFEAGAAGWTTTGNVIFLGYPQWAHSGQGLTWMGSSFEPITESLYQELTLPATMAGAQLRFWLYIFNNNGLSTPDTLKVRIMDTAGAELGTLATFSSLDSGSAYARRSYDLSPYAGKTVRIHFEAQSAGSSATSFLLDDFSLRVALKDLEAPTVTATVAGSRGTLTLEAQAQDDVSVTKVEFHVDGELKGTFPAEPYRTSLDSTTLSNGPHTLVAKAYDATGKIGTSNSMSFNVDNQAPTVTVAASGTKGNITLSASATDNQAIARVEFYVDGSLVGTSTTLPYQVACDSTALQNGTHTLMAKAFDLAGNLGQSSLSFKVDNPDTKAPSLTVYEWGSRGTITLDAYASDNVGVVKMEAYLDDKVVATRSSDSLYEYFDSTRLTDGSHAYLAKAYDAAGNVGTSNTITFTVDNTPPTVSMVGPTSTSGLIKLSATATDNIGVAEVRFLVDDNWVPGGTVSAPPFEMNLDSTRLKNGGHKVRATARDAAGNSATSAEFTFTSTNPDTTAPTLNSVSASGGRGDIYFTAWADDINGVSKVEFYVDGLLKGSYLPTYSYAYLNFDSTTLTDGAHTLTVKAYDPSANVSTSNAVSFTVDNTAPTLSLSTTLDGTTLNVSATAFDAIGINSVTFYVDDSYRGSDYSSPYTLKVDTAQLPNGTHSLKAQAYDAAGNQAQSAPLDIVINNLDTIPPTVNPYIWGRKGNIELAASVNDLNGVTKVEFWVDGDLKASVVPNYGYASLRLDSTKLVDGGHKLIIKAYDAAGNVGSSPSQDFIVDNTPPSQITVFESGTSGNLALSATATDNLGIEFVAFYVDGNYQGTADSAPFILNFDSQYLKNGSHTLTAQAYDAADNTLTSDPLTFTTQNPDTAAPYVSVGAWGSGTLNCYAWASDLNGVVKVEFFVDGQWKGTGTSTAGNPNYFTFNLLTAGLTNGTHDLVAKATDSSGNVGTSYPSTFYVDASDTTPPSISDLQVTGTRDLITLSASVTDNRAVSRVDFLVDGQSKGTRTSTPYSWSLDSTTLDNGTHTFVVKATDTGGNETTSEALAFFLNNPDRTPPAVTVSAEGSAGSIRLAAQVTDNGPMARVEFYVDGAILGSDYEAPFEFMLGSESLTNGAHSLVAKAFDEAGNQGDSAPLSFLVDNTDTLPPITSAWVNGTQGTIRLNASATDNRGVVKVAFYVDGVLKGETATLPFSLTLDSATLANGPHALVAKAFDAAGNVGASPSMAFTISNVEVTATPGRGVVQRGRSLTFSATVTGTDNLGLLWSILEAQGGTITQAGVYTAPQALGTYHLVVASAAYPDAKATITIQVVNPPDLNGDGIVNGIDVGNLARAFSGNGSPAGDLEADLDGDGDVDDEDLAALLVEFGK